MTRCISFFACFVIELNMGACPFTFAVSLILGVACMFVISEILKRVNGMNEFSKIRSDLSRFVETDQRLNSLFPPGYLSPVPSGNGESVTPPASTSASWMELSEAGVRQVRTGLQKRIDAAAIDSPEFADSLFYTLTKSGKMIRSRLIVLLGKALGVADRLEIILLGQAVELEHCASLLHDDVVDEADTRRGIESHRKKFGDRTAILTGDRLISILVDVLAEIRIMDVTETVSQSIEALVIGELLQLMTKSGSAPSFSKDRQKLLFPTSVSDSDISSRIQLYIKKSYFKTAALFAALAGCVAHIADLPEEKKKAIFSFGFFFGLAFQLVDDLLDVVDVDAGEVGKPVGGSDVRNGTVTLPVLLACVDEHRLSTSERNEMKKMVARRFRLGGDCERTMDLLRKSDGISQSRKIVSYYLNQGRRCLAECGIGSELQGLLNEYEVRTH